MKSKFPRIETTKLKVQVYDLLLELIIDGSLKAGEMLPSERTLSEELGVSRTVLREAIKSLETRGVLEVSHGKGIVVKPATSDDISHAFMLYLKRKEKQVDFQSLVELRCLMEPRTARLAAAKATDEDSEILSGILDKMQASIDDVDLFNKLDLEYHLEVAKVTGNILIIAIMEALILPIRETLMVIGGAHNEKVHEQHYKIYECIKANDQNGAERAMRQSITYAQELMSEKETI